MKINWMDPLSCDWSCDRESMWPRRRGDVSFLTMLAPPGDPLLLLLHPRPLLPASIPLTLPVARGWCGVTATSPRHHPPSVEPPPPPDFLYGRLWSAPSTTPNPNSVIAAHSKPPPSERWHPTTALHYPNGPRAPPPLLCRHRFLLHLQQLNLNPPTPTSLSGRQGRALELP
jgi:hypothetical protein